MTSFMFVFYIYVKFNSARLTSTWPINSVPTDEIGHCPWCYVCTYPITLACHHLMAMNRAAISLKSPRTFASAEYHISGTFQI